MAESNELLTFARSVIAEKGMADLSPDVREQLARDYAESLENRINAALLQTLSDKDMSKFEAVLDGGGTTADFERFFKERGINSKAVAFEVMSSFRRSVLSA